MTDYQYIFGSLRDEKIVTDISLFGTYLDLELNAGGRFDGSFKLDQFGKDNQTLIDATIPGRCFIAVEREGITIWMGFIWSRVYQSQAKNVQLYAQSFENYPQYQLIRSAYTQTDEQLTIFKGLWTHMQSVTGRNINVIVPSVTPPTIVSKTVSFLPSDFKFYGEAMSQISDGEDGFDWYIGVNRINNQYIKTLNYGYPTLGSMSPQAITFEYPGAILNYYATETMSTAATNIYTLGAGEGSSMLFHESVQDVMIAQGFPRWDMVVSHKDIDTQPPLDEIGAQERVKRKPPMLVIKPQLSGYQTPTFGSFGLGDACTVSVKDSRFPNGLKFVGRIVKWILNPSSSDSPEEYNVLFEGDVDDG